MMPTMSGCSGRHPAAASGKGRIPLGKPALQVTGVLILAAYQLQSNNYRETNLASSADSSRHRRGVRDAGG